MGFGRSENRLAGGDEADMMRNLWHLPNGVWIGPYLDYDSARLTGVSISLPEGRKMLDPIAHSTEVCFEHSLGFPDVLAKLGVSLLVSTYQAGKVLVLTAGAGTADGSAKLSITFHNFEQPMGMAVGPRSLAISTRRGVWFLSPAHDLAPRIEPAGGYDGAFLVRNLQYTGSIACHDLSWCKANSGTDELWLVNTLFSCLCTLNPNYNFVPRWQPPFITALAAEDRCHLNGLACDGDKPRYVTVIDRTDTAGGWRPNKATSGCILDVPTGEVVTQSLSMPHSPRLHDNKLWVLNSGLGNLSLVDPTSGKVDPIASVPGYTRGLAFHHHYAFIGLSRIRETNVFGGLPIAQKRADLVCGIGVIDIRTGRTVATFMLRSGVEEIFDVQVVPARSLALSGPNPDVDGSPVVWVVPPAGSEG